ncbi:MAG: hypothetical protein ACI4F4_04620 [Lachnospiraceae bacterium]
MREFVFGTDSQYDMLKNLLEDHLCHVYRCTLPSGCSVQNGRIGFEKDQNFYYLYIDKGITYNRSSEHGFIEWLSQGTLIFNDFNDVKVLLKSFRTLYE